MSSNWFAMRSSAVVLLSAVALPSTPQKSCGVSQAFFGDSAQQHSASHEPPVPLRVGVRRCQPEPDKMGDLSFNGRCAELQRKLLTASRKGDVAAIREALSQGANVEGTVDGSFNALHQAAESGSVEAVNLLLDNGAEVNFMANVEGTALGFAVDAGHVEVVKLLLERGASICGEMQMKPTVVQTAKDRGYTEIESILVAAAAKCK